MQALPLDRAIVAMESKPFGEQACFHHVGLAVRSIRDVCPECEPKIEERQGVSVAFVSIHGVTIELLESYGDASPIAASLRKGISLLHICYQVPNLEDALSQCRPAGFHRRALPVPTGLFENARVVWVYSRKLGLFELLELGGNRARQSNAV